MLTKVKRVSKLCAKILLLFAHILHNVEGTLERYTLQILVILHTFVCT